MMSMSGGWFFVVASEAITVGNTTVQLPGLGSWLAVAIDKQDFAAVSWAVLAMGMVIVLYDQLLFRPIVAWADKFRFEQTAGQDKPRSWVYSLIQRTRLLKLLTRPIGWIWRSLMLVRLSATSQAAPLVGRDRGMTTRALDYAWLGLIAAVGLWGIWTALSFVSQTLTWSDAWEAFSGGLVTRCA